MDKRERAFRHSCQEQVMVLRLSEIGYGFLSLYPASMMVLGLVWGSVTVLGFLKCCGETLEDLSSTLSEPKQRCEAE